jgi:enoyl-CoA hydratase
VRFGLNIVPVRPGDLGAVAVRAEDLGFESLWTGEHVLTPVRLDGGYPGPGGRPPFSPDSRFLEPFSTLTYLSAVTSRVRLGTSVVILPLHSPAVIARSVATVDVLSRGRLSLGVGMGWMREEFEVAGQEFTNRGRRADEMIDFLDRVFTEHRPAFGGEFYHLPEAGFEPKPVQRPRPPLLIGGNSPAALRRAARSGDGWIGGHQTPEKIAETVAELRRLRAGNGAGGRPFEITVLTGWGQQYDTDLTAAYAAAGVDRLLVTPWARSSEAMNAVEKFARDARLGKGHSAHLQEYFYTISTGRGGSVADEVLVEHADRIAIITINRPQARNAINHAVSAAMAEAFEELDERDDLTVGIVTGAGGTFSSGMDLKAFLAGENVRVEGKGLAGLTQAPPRKPLIAAVEGWALAGGCEVALACDLIVAANDAKFGIPEVKRGLVAGAGGLIRLPRRIPAGIAMELALTGDPLPAVDAHRLGLVNALTEPGGALDGARALAARIAVNGPLAVAATKQIITQQHDWDMADVWARQEPIMRPAFQSEDAREGALAFAEKRAPVWMGR